MTLFLDPAALAQNPVLVRLNPGLVEQEKPKRSKYGNAKGAFKGRVYDSQKEMRRAQELDLMEKAGEIAGWVPQFTFSLAGGIKYIADFVVLGMDGRYHVEDVKSPATRKDKAYRLKRRLYRERYGREIVER